MRLHMRSETYVHIFLSFSLQGQAMSRKTNYWQHFCRVTILIIGSQESLGALTCN
jgi:hypothetical protein